MIKAVVGANWGDEGKGKITDMLAEKADIIVRFQGGANAGHTIVNDYGKFALHTLPSGVFYGHTTGSFFGGIPAVAGVSSVSTYYSLIQRWNPVLPLSPKGTHTAHSFFKVQ